MTPPGAPGRLRTLWALVAPLVLAACGGARSPFVTPVTASGVFLAGYHPYWAGASWQAYPEGLLDEIYFFELEVAADGSFLDRHGWPDEWRAMIEASLGGGTQVTPTVSMHDPTAFEALFVDPAAIGRLVDGVEGLLVETPGLAGVHLDFEVFQPVGLAARDGFTAFVGRLRDRIKRLDPGLSLSVFTLAFDDDDAYNEGALGAIADYVVVQGYDYHSLGGDTAGPLAAVRGWGRLNWDFVVDRLLGLGVPAGKIVMAAPMYGYQWPVVSDEPGAATRGEAVAVPYSAPADVLPELPRATSQAQLHGLRRDPASGSPYYVFRDETGWHQGWFDDAASVRAKFDFVRARGLGGVALFPAAYVDGELWAELSRTLSTRR